MYRMFAKTALFIVLLLSLFLSYPNTTTATTEVTGYNQKTIACKPAHTYITRKNVGMTVSELQKYFNGATLVFYAKTNNTKNCGLEIRTYNINQQGTVVFTGSRTPKPTDLGYWLTSYDTALGYGIVVVQKGSEVKYYYFDSYQAPELGPYSLSYSIYSTNDSNRNLTNGPGAEILRPGGSK